MTRILALDPGVTTGWAEFDLRDDAPLEHVAHGMIPGGLAGFHAWWRARDEGQWGIVIAEDFHLDGRTMAPDTTPLDILGALQVLRPDLIRQQNTSKRVAPDSLLKRIGLWWPGAGHDRDALRHAIAYARSIRHMPTIRGFWPPRTRGG